MDLRIACFQMNILWHLPNENLKKIIGTTKALHKTSEIDINNQGLKI